MLQRTLCHPDHLRADADSSFVQRLNRGLVALTNLPEDVLARNTAVFEHELACAAGTNAQLVFLSSDSETREAPLDQKRRDAL